MVGKNLPQQKTLEHIMKTITVPVLALVLIPKPTLGVLLSLGSLFTFIIQFQEMFHPHFPDKETESLQVTCSVSHSSGLHIAKSFELVLYHFMLSLPECTSDYPFFDSTAEHISACPPL